MSFKLRVLVWAILLFPVLASANDWGCPPSCECTPSPPPQDLCPDGSEKTEHPPLRGTVLNGLTGLPAASAYITVNLGGQFYAFTYTDSAGNYETTVASGAQYQVKAATLDGMLSAIGSTNVSVGAVCPVTVNLTLGCTEAAVPVRGGPWRQGGDRWKFRHLDCLMSYPRESLDAPCQAGWDREVRDWESLRAGRGVSATVSLECATPTFWHAGCLMTDLAMISGFDPLETNKRETCADNVSRVLTPEMKGNVMDFDRAVFHLGFRYGLWAEGPLATTERILDQLQRHRPVIARLQRGSRVHFVVVTGHVYDPTRRACGFAIADPGLGSPYLEDYTEESAALGGPWSLSAVLSAVP